MLSMKGIDVESRVKDNATNTCLMSASCSGSVPAVELLLDHGAHIEATAKNLATPVYFAAASNNIAVVNLLINRGANIEAKDVSGFTPLHIAAFHGRLNSVKFLIAKGADMNALTNDDSSALGIARRNEHTEIDEFFRSVGAFDDGFDGEEEEEEEDEDLDDRR
jgi:ankyrin repeat protein